MAVIKKSPVTLSVAEVELLLPLLRACSSINWTTARRTKSAAVRAYAEIQGNQARDMDALLVERMYQQESDSQ